MHCGIALLAKRRLKFAILLHPTAFFGILSEYSCDGAFECRLIAVRNRPELPDDHRLFEGGKDRLDGRWLDQSGGLPLADPDLSERRAWAQLAGDGHDHDIGLGAVIGFAADNHCRPFFGSRLICKRKRHQHDIAELIAHCRRRRPGCPRWRQRPVRWRRLRRA